MLTEVVCSVAASGEDEVGVPFGRRVTTMFLSRMLLSCSGVATCCKWLLHKSVYTIVSLLPYNKRKLSFFSSIFLQMRLHFCFASLRGYDLP